jgi:hypothetical protein
MELVLIVADYQGHSVQRVAAVGVLGRLLKVEVLDRDVIVAVPEAAAYGFKSAFSISLRLPASASAAVPAIHDLGIERFLP